MRLELKARTSPTVATTLRVNAWASGWRTLYSPGAYSAAFGRARLINSTRTRLMEFMPIVLNIPRYSCDPAAVASAGKRENVYAHGGYLRDNLAP